MAWAYSSGNIDPVKSGYFQDWDYERKENTRWIDCVASDIEITVSCWKGLPRVWSHKPCEAYLDEDGLGLTGCSALEDEEFRFVQSSDWFLQVATYKIF